MSVSVTTRAKRPGEVDGQHYHFIDNAKFDSMVKLQELLEHAAVFDHHYGTPRKPVEDALTAGEDVLFDIDWQGTQQLREKARDDVVSVFILPPSAEDLERRLHTRAQDSDEVIRGRMSRATHELSHWAEYDYVVINSDLHTAFREIETILRAERLKRERQNRPVRLRARIAGPVAEIACLASRARFIRCVWTLRAAIVRSRRLLRDRHASCVRGAPA